MAIQLVRRPGVEGVNFANPAASRVWIRDHVLQQVKLKGGVHPKIYLLGKGFVETFDLDAMSRREPGADVGVTFQILRRRNNVERCFLVMGAGGQDASGAELRWAVVFEEVDVADGRNWWMGMLEFTTDPASGLGHPVGDWQLPARDTNNPADLPPFLLPFAAPPPGGRPAGIREPTDTWEPDVKFAVGELPAHVDPPTDAKQMVELTAALGVVNELLTGRHDGTVVVRVAGRSWEQFVLTGDMPGPLVEMVRWIANHRLPPADAVAIAMLAIRPQDRPQVPGVQVIGEKDGQYVETWAPIEFPEGPAGKKVVPVVHWWPARPAPDTHRWIGISSKVDLHDPTGFN